MSASRGNPLRLSGQRNTRPSAGPRSATPFAKSPNTAWAGR